MKRLLLIAPAMLACAAFADPAPAPAPAAADAIPAPSCTQPQLKLDDSGKLKNVQELKPQVPAYQACIDAYVAERKQAVDAHNAAAKANRDSANEAIKTFDDFADRLRAAQAAK